MGRGILESGAPLARDARRCPLAPAQGGRSQGSSRVTFGSWGARPGAAPRRARCPPRGLPAGASRRHGHPREGRTIFAYGDLPERIQNALDRADVPAESVVAVLKSSLKPDATIPILWAVVTSRQLLLCSTHARRGIWRTFEPNGVNDVRRTGRVIEIIPEPADEPIFRLPFPAGTPAADIDRIVGAFHDLVKRARA